MKTLITILLFLTTALPGLSENRNMENKKNLPLPKPLLRELEFMKPRAYPFDEVPEGARQNAIKQTLQMMYGNKSKGYMLAQQPEWRVVGPYNVGGRVKSIVYHPTKTDVIYIGAAAGGIWKTIDGGTTWKPLFDFENAIAFGSLAIDVNNPDIMYAGTGEAVPGGGNIYLGSGLYKSTNGGDNWKVIALTGVGAFSKVFVHPKNSNLIYAGGIIKNQGLYKSTDAGKTFRNMYKAPVTDVTINNNDENELFIGVNGLGIYYTNDGGETWSDRNNGLAEGMGRVSVQFAQSNINVLYSLMEASSSGLVYKSTNKGSSWFRVNDGGASFFNNQSFYDNYIMVSPTNDRIAFAGGIDLWRSTDGGNLWVNTTMGYSGGSVHVDQHCGAFNPQNPSQVFIGNDGGVYKSNNFGFDYTDMNNNLPITQFYGIAINQSKQNVNFGGTQDNGTLGILDGQSDWNSVAGGDGFQVVVNASDPNIIIGEVYYGGLWRRNFRTGTLENIRNGLPDGTPGAAGGDPGAWDAPIAADPLNSDVVYHGRTRLYASYNFGGRWDSIVGTGLGTVYTAIEVSASNDEIIYAGNAAGQLIVTLDAGTQWDMVSKNGLPNRSVSDIAASRTNDGIAYVTFSGYNTSHIFKTTNNGKNWTDISRGLPDVPCNSILIHPNNEKALFVGTDVGVFATFDDGLNWFPYGRGLPRSPVTDLAFHTNRVVLPNLVLRAGTHGRSVWEVDVPEESISSTEITSPRGGEVFVSGTNQTFVWYGFTPPVTVEISYNDGESWETIAGGDIGNSMLYFLRDKETIHGRIRVTSQSDPSQVKISNSFSVSFRKSGSLLKTASLKHVAYGIAYDGKGGLWTTNFYDNQAYKLNPETFAIEGQFKLPGDSLFTDLTIDRVKNVFYVHKLYNTFGGTGGLIFKLDMNGKVLRQFPSPAKMYPIGLELVDGNLIVGDRDGEQKLYTMNPETGSIIKEVRNPFPRASGPRGLCYDGKQYIYQVSTAFPNNALSAAYVMKIDKSNMGVALDSIPLENETGLINARGVDIDPRDDNFWISEFGGGSSGGIYKIAGFDVKLDVEDQSLFTSAESEISLNVFPNPVREFATVSFMMKNNGGNLRADMFDMLGKNCGMLYDRNSLAGEGNVFQFSASDFESGVYYIVISMDGKPVGRQKVVILK